MAIQCLISFPSNTPLSQPCPRCGGVAGDHPAPLAMLLEAAPELSIDECSIHTRPTMRELA